MLQPIWTPSPSRAPIYAGRRRPRAVRRRTAMVPGTILKLASLVPAPRLTSGPGPSRPRRRNAPPWPGPAGWPSWPRSVANHTAGPGEHIATHVGSVPHLGAGANQGRAANVCARLHPRTVSDLDVAGDVRPILNFPTDPGSQHRSQVLRQPRKRFPHRSGTGEQLSVLERAQPEQFAWGKHIHRGFAHRSASLRSPIVSCRGKRLAPRSVALLVLRDHRGGDTAAFADLVTLLLGPGPDLSGVRPVRRPPPRLARSAAGPAPGMLNERLQFAAEFLSIGRADVNPYVELPTPNETVSTASTSPP